MKMVKSLLLGAAAGLVAVAGAQAADLPVKAKPVEYVKVCSLYGVGFYYIPGTDTCIKIGGFVRSEWMYQAGGSFAIISHLTGGNSGDTRTANYLQSRSRGVITFDTRTQTEYGTLRSYMNLGLQWSTGDSVTAGSGATTFLFRAFIQFAGFTFGLTTSFFDFYLYAMHSNQTNIIGSDTGGTGTNVLAYTAQFGNGFSASISLEDNTHRRGWVVDLSAAAAFPIGGAPVTDQTGQRYPDVVVNLRVDQAWGSAQISAAMHDASGNYFGTPNVNTAGSPGDKWGYAVQGGVIFNLPWGQGDTLALQGVYTKGAIAYAAGLGVANLQRYSASPGLVAPGAVALAWLTDGVFHNPGFMAGYGGAIQQTTAWALQAGIEHRWSPVLRTSLFGGYMSIDYNGTATALICLSGRLPMGAALPNGPFAGGTGVCNPDFSFWQVGSRTVWTPVRNFDVGLEVMYSKIDTKWNGTAVLPAFAAGARPAGLYNLTDEGIWSAMIRFQRNFWP